MFDVCGHHLVGKPMSNQNVLSGSIGPPASSPIPCCVREAIAPALRWGTRHRCRPERRTRPSPDAGRDAGVQSRPLLMHSRRLFEVWIGQLGKRADGSRCRRSARLLAAVSESNALVRVGKRH
jgi:hypothetical protein